jgi:hypothetical protein
MDVRSRALTWFDPAPPLFAGSDAFVKKKLGFFSERNVGPRIAQIEYL